MRTRVKLLYTLFGVLYFPIGTVIAWYSYNDIKKFVRRCQYDKAEKKEAFDGLFMSGLIAIWILILLFIIPEFF